METTLGFWSIFGILIGIVLSLPTIMGFFRKNRFVVNGKTVLLTGASEGMGLSVAKQLAKKGANVIIVARNVGKLEEALVHIKASAANPSQRFQYISADLSEENGSSRVIAEAIAWNAGQTPDIVWCVAGAATPGLFLETSQATMRRQMDINYWSCVDMAHAILGEWTAPGSKTAKGDTRHLIFTSSVAAFYSPCGYAPYSPSKAAIKSLSDTLAQEMLLYGDDIKIHTVFPGTIASPGLEVENRTKPEITQILEASDPVQTPDVVAQMAIAGLERGEYLITVGWLGDLMKACAWGGSKRSNWVVDTAYTWVASIAWFFIGMDLDGKVKKYGKQHGHRSTYKKST